MKGHVLAACLFALAAAPAITATDAGSGRADLVYELGSVLEGSAAGSCAASAAFPPTSEPIRFSSAGGTWVRDRAAFNYTEAQTPAGPVGMKFVNITSVHAQVPAGPGVLKVGSAGTVVLQSGRPAGETRLHAQFEGTNLRTDPVMGPQIIYSTLREWNGLAVDQRRVAGGPNRLVTLLEGNLTVEGDVLVYVEGAALEVSGGRHEVGPRFETGPRTGTDQAGVGTDYENYALLRLQGARFEFSASKARLYCHALATTGVGTMHAFAAAGRVRLGDATREFAQREFAIEGAFAWAEAPRESKVEATASGEFRAVSIDYERVLEDASGPSLLEASLWATLVAAVVGALYALAKGAFAFYSRLSQDEVAQLASRRLVLETVAANPNVSLWRLTEVTGLPKSLVRYHARVLESRGLLRSHKHRHHRLYVARATLQEEGRAALSRDERVLAEADPLVARLLAYVGSRTVRLAQALAALTQELGVSRPGAWKAVRRAERDGFITRVQAGREVWIRCAQRLA